jgi:hypothetical protein
VAGILKVDQVQSDSNLAFAIAGSNVAFMNATSLQMVGSNVSLAGTNVITNGKVVTAAQPVGAILQVVQTFDTSVASTSSTSFSDLVSVAITPSSASNKVLVRILAHLEMGSSALGKIRLQRNGTNIGLGSTGVVSRIILSQGYGGINGSNLCYEFLDSPATTSAITYKIQWAVTSNTFYYNQGVSYGSSDGFDASTLTAMEIAG